MRDPAYARTRPPCGGGGGPVGVLCACSFMLRPGDMQRATRAFFGDEARGAPEGADGGGDEDAAPPTGA